MNLSSPVNEISSPVFQVICFLSAAHRETTVSVGEDDEQKMKLTDVNRRHRPTHSSAEQSRCLALY